MKVLAVHNYYRQRGGEDVVFESETALLESYGHEVVRYTQRSVDLGIRGQVSLAAKALWNPETARDIRALIRRVRPDIMHVHNTFPMISPSIYGVARAEHVPVVQTLHNFRLVCPGALLLRDGQICEDCLTTRTRWPGVLHGCYRQSRVATGVVVATHAANALASAWGSGVERFIALSEFARSRFMKAGFPPEKLAVKPNCLHPDPGISMARGQHALFVGRLSPEKGLLTLLEAFRHVSADTTLMIVGDGPLMSEAHKTDGRVRWLGQRSRAEVLEIMRTAGVLIMPSESYESMPLTIIEAFASGLPVITTRLGTMAEMVTDGVTGLLFEPRDSAHLADRIGWALSHPSEMSKLASRARLEFEHKYSAEQNHRQLMAIYDNAIECFRQRSDGSVPIRPASSVTSAP